MNVLELVKDLLQFAWDGMITYAQTAAGSAKLAEIVSDFNLGETEPPPPQPVSRPGRSPKVQASQPTGATVETEADRRIRLGLVEE